MTNRELAHAFEPVQVELEKLNVNFYVGGSVASSFHGAARSTLDIDVVTDLTEPMAVQLVKALAGQYYGSESAARDAVNRKSCFNLIHLETSFKIDLFVSKGRPYDQRSMERTVRGAIADGALESNIASVEDVILSKLEWFRIGNEASERQWEDLTRVARTNARVLDRQYLEASATELEVSDLLQRLFEQVSD